MLFRSFPASVATAAFRAGQGFLATRVTLAFLVSVVIRASPGSLATQEFRDTAASRVTAAFPVSVVTLESQVTAAFRATQASVVFQDTLEFLGIPVIPASVATLATAVALQQVSLFQMILQLQAMSTQYLSQQQVVQLVQFILAIVSIYISHPLAN